MKKIIYYLVFATILYACSDDSGSSNSDNYDRKAMLTNWADNIIIPAYENFLQSTDVLKQATIDFVEKPTIENLEVLKGNYQTAYLDYQTIGMFEIGPAENVMLRSYLNRYPADREAIKTKKYNNLTLPSSRDAQGFPAIDYLLYGVANSSEEVVEFYKKGTHNDYLKNVVTRIHDLTKTVISDWKSSFRDNFVNNTSSSATGSVDKFANDFIIHYEKYVRSGKVGIPAGAFSGNIEPQTVESYYNPTFSKQLLVKGLTATKDFFNGKHFGNNQTGPSFADYLNTLGHNDLTNTINNQFADSFQKIEPLNSNLVEQVNTNNNKMLEAFDSMQKNVVFLKTDMLQALSISVDYVDTDGD